jgi:hypothetical protein
MSDNAPSNAFPAGFKGFVSNGAFSGKTLGSVIYKTKFYDSGDVMYYESDGTPVLSGGDKVKRVSLGLSSQEGHLFDTDLFKYKGSEAVSTTNGFHLSVNASGITGFDTTEYDLEYQTNPTTNKLTKLAYRKFTFALGGGFDGWDIYRSVRTYAGEYIFDGSFGATMMLTATVAEDVLEEKPKPKTNKK